LTDPFEQTSNVFFFVKGADDNGAITSRYSFHTLAVQ